MKISILLLAAVLITVSCLGPGNDGDIPSWLQDRITLAETGEDSTYAQAVWRYEYDGEDVYYINTMLWYDYNYVCDEEGNLLGAPDGGWQNAGDGALQDFFSGCRNDTLIWVYDYPVIEDANEEYRIINAVLRTFFYDEAYLHVTASTDIYVSEMRAYEELNEGNIAYDSLMIADYVQRNTEILHFDEDMMPETVHTVHRDTLTAIWRNYQWPEDWQEYYRRYPRSCGIIELSRPGISPSGDMAVIDLGHQFSGDGGQGYIAVLQKTGGHWIVRWTFTTWVS
ncbi:MAG: hypothetical protein U5N56_07475 [Candidatus Marinimicrobia bacterium]|nr:hypothetical protein [Candidatus Neomarinimicrobiota bacterium]